MAKKTRVLVVDDSAVMRELITNILEDAPDIEVVGSASDPFVARELIKTLRPDVLTLDIEMPKMDGLDFLDKIMRLRPMPVVMISGLTQKNSGVALEALALGAVDIIAKSSINIDMTITKKSSEIIEKVRVAAIANLNANPRLQVKSDDRRKMIGTHANYDPRVKIVAIGASAGGVDALQQLLLAYPRDCPGTVITQHMPAAFTNKFAMRLNSLASMTVKEAAEDEVIRRGHVYIAPGDKHLEVFKSYSGDYICKLNDDPIRSGHRPSVDVLFESVAKSAKGQAIGVILTGMGRDGAKGLLAMRQAGAVTLGQDEASSLVYGMAKVARENGAVGEELGLNKIPQRIISHCIIKKLSQKLLGQNHDVNPWVSSQ